MGDPAVMELGALLVYAELLADALGHAEPAIAFKLQKTSGQWEAALALGSVHERAFHAERAVALRLLTEQVCARLDSAVWPPV